jgi:hypothetical protein
MDKNIENTVQLASDNANNHVTVGNVCLGVYYRTRNYNGHQLYKTNKKYKVCSYHDSRDHISKTDALI